jgi:hypothetical protein
LPTLVLVSEITVCFCHATQRPAIAKLARQLLGGCGRCRARRRGLPEAAAETWLLVLRDVAAGAKFPLAMLAT